MENMPKQYDAAAIEQRMLDKWMEGEYYRRNPGGLNCFVDLLSGDVNWPEVRKAFADIGYDGWAAGEMIPPYTHASDQIIYNTSKSMDRILKGEWA